MILNAPAKINLHLYVGPKRKDGYHTLETIFQEISLHDALRFKVTDGPVRLTVFPATVSAGSDNLIVKALELLRGKLRTPKGMDVHLEKRIPVGAGLGGGSSDAAAALKAGWLLWTKKKGTKIPLRWPPLLFECARKIGADVSFFLVGETCWAEGIGEKLSPIGGCKRKWLVLVYPRIAVSTADAYRLLDEHRKSHPRDPEHRHSPKKEDVLRYLRDLRRPGLVYPNGPFNSFQSLVLSNYPGVADARQELIRLGCAPIMMSGSGSTVFGFVKNRAAGESVAAQLRNRPWDVFLAQTRV